MRKIGAILLTFCMLMSLAAVPSFAETVETVVIDATTEVKSFYDNGMNGGNGSLEIFKENLMLRKCGEWVTYDISNLTAGTYSVSVLYKLNGNVAWKSTGLDFAVDGALEKRAYISHTGVWDDPAVEASVGKIYVSEGAKELKVKNHGIYDINLDTITLTYVGAEDTSEDIIIYAQNVTSGPNSTKSGHEFYLGVDYWDTATGTVEDGYTKEDENGLMHLPLTSGSTFQGENLAQHAGDWTRYDISDFKAGTYEVTLKRTQTANATYNMKIDGKTALETTIAKTCTDYSVYEEVVLGKMYVSENAEYLTLLNKGSGSVISSYVKFKYLSAERDEETIPSVKYNGTSVIPGGQGVGFYANSMNGNCPDSLETNNTIAVLRQAGEWVAYDVSNLEVGTYSLNLSYEVRQNIGFYLDIYVDNMLQAKVKPAQTSAEAGKFDGNYATVNVCNVEITKDSKVLKIRNSSREVTNIWAVELSYIADPTDSYVIRQYGDHATIRDVAGAMTYESGVDFYDAAGKDFTGHMEYGIYIADAGDWARYDINGLKPGTYSMTYNHKNSAASHVKVKVDGEVMLAKELAATAGEYNDTTIGNIYIPEGAEYLILENTVGAAIYSKYFDLEYISDEEDAWPHIEYKASGVISGGQNVGYFDTSANGTLEISGSSVALRPSEWLKYDVSDFKPGTYDLTIVNSAIATINFDIKVDNKLCLLVDSEKTGTSWIEEEGKVKAEQEEHYLGTIYIGEDTQTVTVKNVSASATTFISQIIFDNVSDEDVSVISAKILSTEVLKDEGEIVEGTSFYDAGGAGKFETSSGGIVLRQGDWARYDLAALGLEAGIYTVYANGSTNGATIMGVSTEGEAAQKTTAIGSKMLADEEVAIGTIVVDEDTSYFTVSCEHLNRIILYSLRLAGDVEASTTVSYTSDKEGANTVDTLSGLEKVYVTVDIIRPEKASIGETVYVALYEGEKLESVQPAPVTDGYRYTNTFEVTGLGDLSKVKTFVWETDKYIPVISIADTTISAQ